MKIAVCVKYVPVVSRIQFDYEQKTIMREGVPSEVNPFDLLGVTCAVNAKSSPEDEVSIISMGPPQAREGILECLALGADKGTLLTDRALAGSDTLATAMALASALRLDPADLIICGRNSSDAETGQVGPELAELLDIPHISQVTKLTYEENHNQILVHRATDEGYQVIRCPLPALICVTEGIAEEQYADPEDLEAAQQKPLQELSCDMLSSDPSIFGLSGSPTWVEDIRLVEPNRKGIVLSELTPKEAAIQISEQLKTHLEELDTQDLQGPSHMPDSRYPDSHGKSIWVISERGHDGLRQVTLEMLGKSRELSRITQSEVVAVFLGTPNPEEINLIGNYGADRVKILDTAQLGALCSRRVADALALSINESKPYAVLFGATPDGRDLASRVAAQLKLGLTGDAIDLEINDSGQLIQLKPALGGNVIAPILSKTLPNLVTLRPGLLTPIIPYKFDNLKIEKSNCSPSNKPDITILEEHVQEHGDGLGLSQSQLVLGVGMGIGNEDNLLRIQEIAQSIGANLCTTRNVVHSGWLPHQVQVGISGRTIAPKIYLAVGIRGAFNHTVGIQKAGVILAINSNRRAAIFQAADYGIIGDWETYLPPLIEALKPIFLEVSGETK